MRNRLIIDGNAVYEIDDECVKRNRAEIPAAGEMEKIRWPRRGRRRIRGGDIPPPAWSAQPARRDFGVTGNCPVTPKNCGPEYPDRSLYVSWKCFLCMY